MAFRTPPTLPEAILPEKLFLSMTLALRREINKAYDTFRTMASGRDLKKFVKVLNTVHTTSTCFNLTLFSPLHLHTHDAAFFYVLSNQNCYAGDAGLVANFCNWQLVQLLDSDIHWSVPSTNFFFLITRLYVRACIIFPWLALFSLHKYLRCIFINIRRYSSFAMNEIFCAHSSMILYNFDSDNWAVFLT